MTPLLLSCPRSDCVIPDTLIVFVSVSVSTFSQPDENVSLCVCIYAVDVVLFCALTELQLQLYRALLRSRAMTSCLHAADSAQHLRCISALKKLCNHAQLLHAVSVEASAIPDDPEVFCAIVYIVGNFELSKPRKQ